MYAIKDINAIDERLTEHFSSDYARLMLTSKNCRTSRSISSLRKIAVGG
jgi:hypothetical protein